MIQVFKENCGVNYLRQELALICCLYIYVTEELLNLTRRCLAKESENFLTSFSWLLYRLMSK